MEKKDYIWLTGIFAVGILVGWLIWGRTPKTSLVPAIITKSDTIHDTIPHNIPIPYPYPIKGDTVWVPVQGSIDSGAIIKKYYAKIFYNIPWADSLVIIKITDTVSQNSILYRKITYTLLKPTVINQTITQLPNNTAKRRWDVYASANVSVFSVKPELGAGILLLTPERFGFGLKYDVLNNNTAISILYRLNK